MTPRHWHKTWVDHRYFDLFLDELTAGSLTAHTTHAIIPQYEVTEGIIGIPHAYIRGYWVYYSGADLGEAWEK